MKKGDDGEERCGDFGISLDLVVEILKKLPAKSLVRFRCVSKEWSTIICSRRDFIESIVTRSKSLALKQSPLFIFHHCVPETFFTVSSTFSETSNPAAVSIPGSRSSYYLLDFQYVRGLICCSSPASHLVTIYNPTTRQSLVLPDIKLPITKFPSSCYFGYDPVMNQYKVLSLFIDSAQNQTIHVLTLGREWRQIQFGIDEKILPWVQGVCTDDGTIYYAAVRVKQEPHPPETVLLGFDISSERFYHVWAPEAMLKGLSSSSISHRILFNHLGKLGCIASTLSGTSLWILENPQKQEWSKVTFSLPQFPLFSLTDVNGFSGVTPAGEIFAIQSTFRFNEPSYVYYYDMKQNSFRRVQVPGTRTDKFTKYRYAIHVFAIHDHVDNTLCF